MQSWVRPARAAALVLALLLPTHSAGKVTANKRCSEKARIEDSDGWRFLARCGAYVNAHFGAYSHEALALPALATLGAGAQRALILGGADGGVATQLLKSPDVREVLLVSNDADIKEQSIRQLSPISDGWLDERLTHAAAEPSVWLSSAAANDAGFFDIVVVLDDMEDPEDLEPAFRFALLQHVAGLMAPRSVLVQQGASIWNLPRIQSLHSELRMRFAAVTVLQTSTIEREPWHEVHFIAAQGGPSSSTPDVLQPDWAWWDKQRISGIFYRKELHSALLVPAATVSRALGLRLPAAPDLRAAQERDSAAPAPGARPRLRFKQIPLEKLYEKASSLQKVEVLRYDGWDALELDGELQLTSRFGDFYHEALVHPAMAALGRRGRSVLIIGAGDGGVATTVMRYPGVERAVQLEIDEAVVNASREFLPETSRGFDDSRLSLMITDAIRWVHAEAAAGTSAGRFDLCVIDTTDSPLRSTWTRRFYRDLRSLLAPHGAVVQNVGSMGEWLWAHRVEQQSAFRRIRTLSVNSPEYPSPYHLSVLTDTLDLDTVDWAWWSSLGIETIYYHPTLHAALLVEHRELKAYYEERGAWDPRDSRSFKRKEKMAVDSSAPMESGEL